MKTSDEELALQAAAGDRDAFSVLVDRHYDRLFALCFRLTGSRAEAEDLTQDICLALPAKLSGFRREAKLTTWLYRVAVNSSHDRRRRRQTRARAAEGWGDWEIARTKAAEEDRERADWLQDAMAGLTDDLRDTLALVLDGITHAEAAAILDVSEGTVSWRMSEIKKRLRALSEGEAQ